MLKKIIKKAQYVNSVTILYGVTLFLLWQGISPLFPSISNRAGAQQNTIYLAQPALTKPRPKDIVIQSGTPTRIIIPELAIDKTVLPGVYDNTSNTWGVSDAGVHYAGPSVPANDHSGSTLIYGHNNKYTFGPLQYLEPGDLVMVITENNLQFTYKYVAVNDYSPNDTSIFDYDGPPTLSLQTCTGWLNEIRSLYTFNLQTVEKI